MAKRYQRLSEEKRNTRRAVYLIALTIALIFSFFTFGLPLVAKLSTFVADLKKSSQPVDINDTTPPAPPKIDTPEEYTNEPAVEITGKSEEGATIIIYANGKKKEMVTDKNGEFFFDFELRKGENRLSAKAIDKAGNESQETQEYIIVNDSEAPEITILNPQDTSFHGSQQRQVTIEGQTEEGAEITINERFVIVDSEGLFTFTTTLNEGENKFIIKAKDKAENETETELVLNFTP